MCHLGGIHVKRCVINLIGLSKALAIALGTYTIVELEGMRSIYSRRLTSVSFSRSHYAYPIQLQYP
jgi:hypothetical protein